MDNPIWTPTAEASQKTEMAVFCRRLNDRLGAHVFDGNDLRAWAEENTEAFWSELWDAYGIVGDKGAKPHLVGSTMRTARFFPGASLNFAENLLRMGGARDPDAEAIIFRSENGQTLRWSWGQLEEHVSRLQKALTEAGVEAGDRVAALLPNRPEAIAAMLATVSLGAIWCSASPDFGVRAVLDRFHQISPKVLFAIDGYNYSGKQIDIRDKVQAVSSGLETVGSTIVVDQLGLSGEVADTLATGVTYDAILGQFPAGEISFARQPFDHPLYILFSSGTTGAPKCIVHRAGGVLLQHLKEHALHADIKPGDRVFYFTTLGWMMWNWLVSALMRNATLMLFDGSPFHPYPATLFDYAQEERFTHFGTSAKYIDSLQKAGLSPVDTHDLSGLRAMLSTGSPLLASAFAYVYRNIKPDIHLSSMSGGTDIVSCFVCGDPTAPVFAGEIQGPGIGMAVDVWAAEDTPAGKGEKGELVCTRPFPSMPLGFWGDDGQERYRKAYFDTFPEVWCQGDFCERTENGGYVIHGRSDATLNPGGVRIGTAEIYAEVEKFPQVLESVVVGHDADGDQRVILFVLLKDGLLLDDDLRTAIKRGIRQGSSPRHVPAEIIQVAGIPRTKSGKISEIAVKDVIHGRAVKNADALDNPEALMHFAIL